MNYITDMNRCTGPRTAAEAHGVTLRPGHRCEHACQLTTQPATYHPQCRERAACVLELADALERIEIKAQAGLCYFTLESAREFLKDIRAEVADALGKERPRRD